MADGDDDGPVDKRGWTANIEDDSVENDDACPCRTDHNLVGAYCAVVSITQRLWADRRRLTRPEIVDAMQLSRLSERLEICIIGIILRLAALEDRPLADWLGLGVFFGGVHVE